MDDQKPNKEPTWASKIYDDDPGRVARLAKAQQDANEANSAVDLNGFPQDTPQDDYTTPSSSSSLDDLRKGENAPVNLGAGVGALAGEAAWLTNLGDAKGLVGTTALMTKSLTRKRVGMGIGLGGGVAGIFIGLFMALLPLQLNMIMDNLQAKYFSGVNNAVDGAVDKMFTKYLKEKILPGMNKAGCGSTKTISKDCVAVSENNTPFGRLANAWRDGRLENRMAEKYGIELERSPNSTTFTVKIDGEVSNVDVEGFRKNPNSNLWTATGSRSDVRRTVRVALENETGWKKMLYRHRVGKLLERKYGVKRCFVACTTRDRFADAKDKRKQAFKLMVTQKALVGRSALIGEALSCIIDERCVNGGSDRDGNSSDDLQRKDALQKNITKYFEKQGREMSSEAIEAISTKVIKIQDAGGLGKFIAIELAEKLAGEAGKQLATTSIPIIGQIDFAATLINRADTIGPKLKKMNYMIGTASAASFAVSMLTASDEQKRGFTSSEVAASMGEALSDTAGDADHKGQPAETSPMYQALFGSQQETTAFNIFTPSVSAASTATGYTCPDKTPVPSGKLACDDETFIIDNPVTAISDIFNIPGLNLFSGIAGFWVNTVGRLKGLASDAIMGIMNLNPAFVEISNRIGELTSSLVTALGEKIFKSFISDSMSGARAFQGLSAGMDVISSNAGEFGIGGGAISQEQSNELLIAEEQKAEEDFVNQPLYARIFGTENSRSLVGQVAMAMPFTTSTAVSQTANSVIKSPFATITSSFGSLFTRKASAANNSLPNPFRTLRYGYPLGSAVLEVDPSTLTNEYCAEKNDEWADNVVTDNDTGMDKHVEVNPCLLYSTATSAAGGAFSDEALNDSANTTTPTAPTQSPDTTAPTGSGKWKLSPGANRPGASLTPLLTQFMDELAKHTSFEPIITTGTNHSKTTTSGNISDHWAGNGADFGSVVNGFGTSNARPNQIVPKGDEIAAAAMIACGTDPEKAKAQAISGGVFLKECTLNGKKIRVQVLWKTSTGGNHYNHVHVGVKAL